MPTKRDPLTQRLAEQTAIGRATKEDRGINAYQVQVEIDSPTASIQRHLKADAAAGFYETQDPGPDDHGNTERTYRMTEKGWERFAEDVEEGMKIVSYATEALKSSYDQKKRAESE